MRNDVNKRPTTPGDLAAILASPAPPDHEWYQGVVSAVNFVASTATVNLAGSISQTNVIVLGDPAKVSVDQSVLVLRLRTRYFIMGTISALAAAQDGAMHGLSSLALSATFTGETLVMTGAPSPTVFRANRVYQITLYGLTQNTTSPFVHTYRVKKTNAAGQQLIESRAPVNGNTPIHDSSLFKVGVADVSATLVVTAQSSGGTGTWIAGATFPRGFFVQDIGSASNPAYAGVTTLV